MHIDSSVVSCYDEVSFWLQLRLCSMQRHVFLLRAFSPMTNVIYHKCNRTYGGYNCHPIRTQTLSCKMCSLFCAHPHNVYLMVHTAKPSSPTIWLLTMRVAHQHQRIATTLFKHAISSYYHNNTGTAIVCKVCHATLHHEKASTLLRYQAVLNIKGALNIPQDTAESDRF